MTRLPGNLNQIRALMPEAIYSSYEQLRRAMDDHSTLGVRLRELVRIKSAELAGCEH